MPPGNRAFSLAELIQSRRELGHGLQEALDRKMHDWGIQVQSVEIRDVVIPEALEEAMSRQAQAERERAARAELAHVGRVATLGELALALGRLIAGHARFRASDLALYVCGDSLRRHQRIPRHRVHRHHRAPA